VLKSTHGRVRIKMSGSVVSKSTDAGKRTDTAPLLKERRFLQEHRSRWSVQYAGMFLLIKGDCLVGAYPDASSAYQAGSSRFGWEPFLVEKL
jgi:hypothetical protein